ncbi:MAG: ParB N-terminal domain-containing protein [Coprococcus comes]|nr:ParB N-terminal domain-containing protein [Coprococcus comes]
MTTSGITNINAKLIHQHPDNPRKDLGDLSELSESIKKKGIMQNLTVIPGYWDENRAHHDEGYTLIIGHRRFAAGKMAGVTMYPCRIVEDMSYKDQVGTMLEEHHVLFGNTHAFAEAEGLKVNLCLDHHRNGPAAVHNNAKNARILMERAQEVYERTHTREEWMKNAGKNYL